MYNMAIISIDKLVSPFLLCITFAFISQDFVTHIASQFL